MRQVALGLAAPLLVIAAATLPRGLCAEPGDRLAETEGAPISLETIQRVVRKLKVNSLDRGSPVPLKLQKGPLIRHTDPIAIYRNGTMWVWGAPGRPPALMVLSVVGSNPQRKVWCYEFISLTTGRLVADDGAGARWSPRKPGWNPRPIPAGPAPAETRRGRLTQIKRLVRRFAASHYEEPGSPEVLRLLPQPIYQYDDPDSGALAGALFIFCRGTNPEVLLVVQLRDASETDAAWQYNISPVTAFGLTVKLDDKVVWTRPAAMPTAPGDPYWIHFRTVTEK